MAFSSGTFSLYTPGNPVVTGTTISSTWANNTLTDIATGLTSCVLKDGTQTITANIPFAGFRITGIGAGSGVADAIQVAQVQNHSTSSLTAVSGTNTVIGTATPTPSAYALGQIFEWIQATTNTGAPTLNVSTLGAINLFKNTPAGLAACVAGDLIAGCSYLARYDSAGSTQFVVLNPSIPRTVGTGLTATGTLQADALEVTQRTNFFSTVASGAGAKLWSAVGAGYTQTIYNGGANPLSIYPDSGSKINNLSTNGKILLTANTSCRFERVSSTQWIALLSA